MHFAWQCKMVVVRHGVHLHSYRFFLIPRPLTNRVSILSILKRLEFHQLVDARGVAPAHHLALHGLRRIDRHPPGVQGILAKLHIDAIQHTHQLV